MEADSVPQGQATTNFVPEPLRLGLVLGDTGGEGPRMLLPANSFSALLYAGIPVVCANLKPEEFEPLLNRTRKPAEMGPILCIVRDTTYNELDELAKDTARYAEFARRELRAAAKQALLEAGRAQYGVNQLPEIWLDWLVSVAVHKDIAENAKKVALIQSAFPKAGLFSYDPDGKIVTGIYKAPAPD